VLTAEYAAARCLAALLVAAWAQGSAALAVGHWLVRPAACDGQPRSSDSEKPRRRSDERHRRPRQSKRPQACCVRFGGRPGCIDVAGCWAAELQGVVGSFQLGCGCRHLGQGVRIQKNVYYKVFCIPAWMRLHLVITTWIHPWRPSTIVPHSALARHGHGMHCATTTPASPGEGRRRLGHRLSRSVEDTTMGGSVCCKSMFQVFQIYVASVFIWMLEK
jgi:hypothetical protein